MKYIDFDERYNQNDFFAAMGREFVPEMRRISKKRNMVIFEPEYRDLALKNMRMFMDGIAAMIEVSMLRCCQKSAEEQKVIRIEMMVVEDAFIRFRFISLNVKLEPILPEKSNPLFLFLPRPGDKERLEKEGYDYIGLFSPSEKKN